MNLGLHPRTRSIALVFLLCSGCYTAPMTVGTHGRAPSSSTSMPNKTTPTFCTLRITPPIDKRNDPDVLGSVGGRAVRAPENHRAWLQNELDGLRSRGVSVSLDSESTNTGWPALNADVELLNAWINSVATSKTATVVLRFSYRSQTSALESATYRGNVTNVNLVNSDGEIQRLLDQAFDQALDQAALDIRRLCKAS